MIRLAEKEDLAQIVTIIDQAKESLKKRQIDQWQDGYPNAESLTEDIFQKRLYVLLQEEEVLAVCAMITYEPTYDHIIGQWHYDEPYIALHRFAVKEAYKGHGLAGKLFDHFKKDHAYIRVDTHIDNLSMQKALCKNGFVLCGTIILQNNAPRFAYDYHRHE